MIKKVLVAPDSFKGTMSALEICLIIEDAFKKFSPETQIVKIPVADGGEGTVDAYLGGLGGQSRTVRVAGPLGDMVDAKYGILKDGTAVIEMAAASGLTLVKGELKALEASSFGTGQMILDAVENGCGSIILGIGGSAVSDGGIGALSALGVRFLDANGADVPPNAKGLLEIHTIDAGGLHPKARNIQIRIACDVTNPLMGKNGAAFVYSPQKGATPEQVERIDAGLAHYNSVLTRHTGADRKDVPGTGAAGGIALSLLAFLNAGIESGIELILDVAGFDSKLKGADFVITGEGKVDGQSVQGKVLAGVARHAAAASVPVVALVGDVGRGYEKLYQTGITAIFSTNRAAVPFEVARRTCKEDLSFLMESLLKFYNIKSSSM